MDTLMVSLRVLHIVIGVFLVGSLLFFTLVLQPRLRALGPSIQIPVMTALLPEWASIVMFGGAAVIAGGAAIALVQRWGHLDSILTTGWGWAILLGTVTTVIAYVVGSSLIAPAGNRLVSLSISIRGRPPTPDGGGRELGQLGARMTSLSLLTLKSRYQFGKEES